MEGDQDNSLDIPNSECQIEEQAKIDAIEKKAIHLRAVIEKDYKAADLKWSLFVAAARSYRYETCLRPFPPHFIKNGVKDMDSLLAVISRVPAFDLFVKTLDQMDDVSGAQDIIELLFWILVKLRDPMLKSVPDEMYECILKLAEMTPASKNEPTHIFKVVSSSKHSAERKWQEIAKSEKTFYAFHNNRLENFHSILFLGLHPNLNKNCQSGSGIYLSSSLARSACYCQDGFCWGASCLGGNISCLALCELADAPEGINCHRPILSDDETVCDMKLDKGVSSTNTATTVKETPHTFYFVTNNDLVRVRYILVYSKTPSCVNDRIATEKNNQEIGVTEWLANHKLLSILLGYGIMFATIGFSNNQSAQYYYRFLMNKIEVALENFKV